MPTDSDERRKYIEAHGRPAWKDALAKAARHRARAEGDHGLNEHFTAPEWLDLCAVWDLRCPFCRAAPEGFLTPHHLLPLSRGDGNKIGNILPICRRCHSLVHDDFRINCHPGWLRAQFALCERFKAGDYAYHSPQPDAREREGG